MVCLREVADGDLPVFYEQFGDPEARHVAAFTGEYHYDRGSFEAHWAKVRRDPEVVVRTVLADGVVAGHAAVFGPAGEREVTYWIGRDHWGRGIGTAAVRGLVGLVGTRPLHARAAADNAGSIRVLEKCGFAETRRERGFARARGGEIDEVVLTLD